MPEYDVFLSHNSADKPAVELLARQLVNVGIQPWLDKWNLVPGEPWQEGLEEALDACQTVAIFLGPSGIGSWENEEMRSALEERVRDKSRRVIPVLLPGAPDPREKPLPRFLRRMTWVDFRGGLDPEDAFQRLVARIRSVAPGGSDAPPAPAAARPTPAFDRAAEGTFSFPGTPEQFVNWLRGSVRPGLWKASPGNEAQPDTRRFIPVADYYAMLRRRTDVHIYPFEPPPSLDFPVTLQIKGRVSWADPEHDGAQKHSDLHVLIQFEIICPIPGGIKVRVDCFDSAAQYYLDALLARLREDWGKRTDERSEQAALERELAQRKSNLYKLREQAAIYAAGETPLHLLNQIEAEEMEIRCIEEQLRALDN